MRFPRLVLTLVATVYAVGVSAELSTPGTPPSAFTAPSGSPEVPLGPESTPPMPPISTTNNCVEGTTCVQGPCHLHASCANGLCVYINADDDTYCEDRDGFGGKCLTGECIVQRQAVIKSHGDHLVFHTPTGGDFLYSSSDLSKDLSMRDMAARLSNTEDAAQSLHTRADAIETKAEGAAANHQGLANRVDALDADITNQFVLVNTYVGDVEAKADTNADDLVRTAADVASNTKDIASLRTKDVEIDGKLAGLESSKATRSELTEAVEDLEDQLQAEAADIRVLQDEMGTKVIQLTDQTTSHNSFIKDMQANIASLGGRVDSNDANIAELQQTRLTQAQVEGVVGTLLSPVEAKTNKIESDVEQLRRELNAIELEPLEKQIAINTIAARLGAGLGPGKTLTDTQVFTAAKAYCGAKSNGFDADKVECKECTGGQVDENDRCMDTNLAFAKLPKDLTYSDCNGRWDYLVLGDKAISIVLKKATRVELTANFDLQLQLNQCGTTYSYMHFNIDGVRQRMCAYPYHYQYNVGYSYAQSSFRRPFLCTLSYELAAGKHIIDVDMLTHGQSTVFSATSLVTARTLSPTAATAKTESGACSKKTAQTLLTTHMSSTLSYGSCTGRRGYYLGSYYANRGRWTLSSQTGRVRITLRARSMIYPSVYCYTAQRMEIHPVIKSSSLGAATTNLGHAHYLYEYDRTLILVDFIHDVGVGSFTLDFIVYFDGQQSQLYSDAEGGNNYLRVEDIPKQEVNPANAALPTGRNGIPRRYLAQSYVAAESNIARTSSATTRYILLRDMDRNTNVYDLTFKILQEKTRVRLYVKVDTYLYSTRNYASALSVARLIPYIDGKSLGTCSERTKKSYIYEYDYEQSAQVCDMEFVLEKGEHKLRLQHYGLGEQSAIRTGAVSSMVLLEELVHEGS